MLRHILNLAFLLSATIAFSQPNINSPYSRFGIGDIEDRNFYTSRFMGGLGASYTDPYQINIVNPASIAHMNVTAFDVGLYAKSYGLRDGDSGPYQQLWSGNISYLSLALPLQNRVNDLLERKRRSFSLASAITLMPYSSVGYNIATTSQVDGVGEVVQAYEGTGGTYQFLWSNGVRFKNISFGFNLGYLFGKIENSSILQFDFEEPYFNSVFTETNRVRGFLWDLGAIYTIRFNSVNEETGNVTENKQLNIGIYGHSKSNLTSKYVEVLGSVQNGTGIENILSTSDELVYNGTLPSEVGMGASFSNTNKFGIGFNYSKTYWSQFDANFVNNLLNNTTNLSFGGFYRPNYKSISNYLERIYYRFGFYYNQVPNAIPDQFDTTIEDIGFTVGFGMPFFYQRSISHANIGFNYGWKGRGTAVEERYLRLMFSFTFNDDEWFIKRKYN